MRARSRDHGSAAHLTRGVPPLEAARRRSGLKVALLSLWLLGNCPVWATFAQRLRSASTFGLRQMPATRKRLSASCDFAPQSSSLRSSGNPTPSARANLEPTLKDTEIYMSGYRTVSQLALHFNARIDYGSDPLP